MNRKVLPCLVAVVLALGASDIGAQQDPAYVLSVENKSASFGGTLSVGAFLDTSGGTVIQGWSFGICHDEAALTLVDATTDGTMTATINGGSPAGFLNIGMPGGGYTLGVVIDLFGQNNLPPSSGNLICIATYDNLMPADGATSDMCPCNTLGTPPVSTVVVVGGSSVEPTTTCGTATTVGIPEYRRGDANQDGSLNIADGIWILNAIFQDGPSFDCLGASDANSDSSQDASDAVYIFNHQFLNGPPPAAPQGSCGGDADPDPTDCAGYTGC